MAEAAQLTNRFGVGAVVVVDSESRRPAGIVTDRDVVVRGVARRVSSEARIDSI